MMPMNMPLASCTRVLSILDDGVVIDSAEGLLLGDAKVQPMEMHQRHC